MRAAAEQAAGLRAVCAQRGCPVCTPPLVMAAAGGVADKLGALQSHLQAPAAWHTWWVGAPTHGAQCRGRALSHDRAPSPHTCNVHPSMGNNCTALLAPLTPHLDKSHLKHGPLPIAAPGGGSGPLSPQLNPPHAVVWAQWPDRHAPPRLACELCHSHNRTPLARSWQPSALNQGAHQPPASSRWRQHQRI
jgi:hypothetical protein